MPIKLVNFKIADQNPEAEGWIFSMNFRKP